MFEEDRPTFWRINIGNNTDHQEYARVLPLLVAPVSLAFSSDVTNIIGKVFVINVTLATGGRRYHLKFTSMGIVNSTEFDDVEVLQFIADVTGRYSNNWRRESNRDDSYILFFKEETAGTIEGEGRVNGHKVSLQLVYDSKDNKTRFNNVRLSMNHTTLELSPDNNSLSFNLSSGIEGWNSSCPVGSGGFRCYACRAGYYGRPRRGRACRKCMCNGHSTECHRRSGRCHNCANNTRGRHCQHCKKGFIGDAVNNGTCQSKLCILIMNYWIQV